MRKALLILTLVGLTTGVAAAINRDDCPGIKLCPLTGQPVCVDRCPLQK